MSHTNPVTVTINGQPVASPAGLTFSNADPGGCELATFHLPPGTTLRPGADVAVRHGMAWAWHGRVNAPGARDDHRGQSRSLEAVGHGVALKDDPTFSMIYVDRDLSRWRPPSRARKVALLEGSNLEDGGPFRIHDASVSPDADGNPVIIATVSDTWVSPHKPISEAFYNAGPDLKIASIHYDVAFVGGGYTGAWDAGVRVGANETLDSPRAETGDLSDTISASGYLDSSAIADARYASAFYTFGTTPGGTDGKETHAHWKLAVYGDHGLTLRGTAPGGLYPQDIARHAVATLGLPWELQVTDQADYIAPHVTYPAAVAHEQVPADMAGLLGWHWGTWPPGSILGDRPVFVFAPPPTQATCVLRRRDCDTFDAPQVRVDRLYNACRVTYRDPAGTIGHVTVTQPNALLDQAGIKTRTLPIDMGIGSAASAQDYGELALGLAIQGARGGGSATVRGDVRLPGGGRKPACLLRSGRDRIQIPDLPDAGPLVGADDQRTNTFLVRRVESSLQNDGSLSTRIEFDQGADLLEVLQARLATAMAAANIG